MQIPCMIKKNFNRNYFDSWYWRDEIRAWNIKDTKKYMKKKFCIS